MNQAHNQRGEDRAFAAAPKVSGIILDFIKKGDVDLLLLVKPPESTIDYMYCKLRSLLRFIRNSSFD